ncbi:MAG: UdgX family uracil-DNA binding protein [Bryobacteraceae bacterium]|nr:UdgX family uracil-DNA binding protein [Bryobacteraceae bacterium]
MVITISFEPTFTAWREKARQLLQASVPPADVIWGDDAQSALFASPLPTGTAAVRVPKAFLDHAQLVACHRSNQRWSLLYRVLYRLTHGEPYLLEVQTDTEVRELFGMRKEVTRDMHQMKAFVRFRQKENRYIAWYEPDHLIVEALSPWFARRFHAMHWSILTPDLSAHWNTGELTFSPGVPRSAAPDGDDLEDLWRAYYASTFNPSRVNVDLLRQHMPERRWGTLPEAELIRQLARESIGREQGMIGKQVQSAAPYVPSGADLPLLQEAIHECRGCDLWQHATQPVFGEGPGDARLMFVGEQPGDNEDREGRPFVGPAGQLFDRALAEAGLEREHIYITSAVKHFRYEARGKARIHKTASKAQIAACQPWLEAELQRVKPRMIVAMGNTAVLSVIGRGMRLLEERGVVMPHRYGGSVLATVHPSFLLRMPDPARQEEEYAKFVADIRTARTYADAA